MFDWFDFNGKPTGMFKRIVVIAALCLTAVTGCMGGMPVYNVWEQEMTGKAELARASQNRQIAEFDAVASLARAEGEANAEVARARGVAEANRVITDSLGGPSGYLDYLYIQALRENEGDVIYVPTEAGIPLLEANRLRGRTE